MLLNLRFVPMGIAIAPWLPHGSLGRALRGQALVDASWALANRGDGRFDTEFLVGSTLVQYPAWVLGTVLGVVVGASIGNPDTLGLDAIFPAFFLGLLLNEIRRPGAPVVSALGAVIALALTPLTPAGVPIIAASAGRRCRAAPGAIASSPPAVTLVSAAWATVAGLAIATAAIKAFGPVVFGGRELPSLLGARDPAAGAGTAGRARDHRDLRRAATLAGASMPAQAASSWPGSRCGGVRRSTWSCSRPRPRPRCCGRSADGSAAQPARGECRRA